MATALMIADYLKYANLQMAAEAFLATPEGNLKPNLTQALIEGNGYASRFTAAQATEFLDPNTGWTVVAQKPNTETGFSGTLFRNNETGELVLSFRSTEFVRDAIRDSAATNTLEINATGWAWGQIADMEAWYRELLSKVDENGQPVLAGKAFSVTGYSLGGHLATAFNLLHGQEALADGTRRIKEVVTFNGAGVGQVKTGTLTDALNYFTNLIANPAAVKAGLMLATPELAQFYDVLHQNLLDGTWTAEQAKGELSALNTAASAYDEAMRAALEAEKAPLYQALNEIIALQEERARIAGFTSDGSGTSLGQLLAPASETVAETLDYRLAVILAGRNTNAANLVIGALLAVGEKAEGTPQLSNQWDLVGIETSSLAWSAVAHSLWHHGTDVPVFIEDQPFMRGDMSIVDLLRQKFLKDKFSLNNFSDTHSLVLIVDSLSVQNTLLQLVGENHKSAAVDALDAILKAASWHTKEQISNEQGHAEGDVLENVVNALSDLFLGPKPKDDSQYLKGSLVGNTWAEIGDGTDSSGTNYTGREKFYQRLKEITNKIAAADPNSGDPNLLGKFTLQASTGNLAVAARNDFLAYAALYSLSPFVLKAAEGTTAEQIETALADAWGATFLDWSADKATVAAGQTATDVTDQWLKDRADFLERKQWFNANNQNPVNPGATYNPEGPRDFSNELGSSHYTDLTSGYEIQQGLTFQSTRVYAFGSSDDDHLVGNALEDHLYGGGGIDILQGMGGSDWLEGNAADDILDGGEGNDTLIGGQGNDLMIGGAGTDRYVVSGNDTIRDADGLGAIVDRSGRLIAGVIEEQADGSYVFLLDPAIGVSKDTNLTLSLADGTQVVIENFQSGQLGLNIARHATGDATALTITGDLKPADTDPTKDGLQIGYDALGNLIVSGEVQEGRNDVLYDSTGADLILGLAGNDIIHAVNGGGDRIEGGAGMDRIDGGADADLVIGGADVDTIYGGAGNDRLYADELVDLDTAIAQGRTGPGSGAGETLDGGFGDDIVIGGTGNDALSGGGGVDVIVGGAGEDTIDAGDDADLIFGGAGRDMITAGSGADLVQGGEGTDIVNGGAGDDRLYADEVVDEQVAIARGDSATGTGNQGDWLNGGLGDDLVIGGDDNDVLFGGGGNDLIIGGAGDDVINAGDDYTAMGFTWTVSTTSNPFDRIWWPPFIDNVGGCLSLARNSRQRRCTANDGQRSAA